MSSLSFGRIGAVTAAAAGVAAAAAVAMALAGFGTRWGWWDFRSGFALLRWAAWGGVAGLLLSLLAAVGAVALKRSRPAAVAVLGMAAGAAAFGIPWAMLARAQHVPPIHDISTDTVNPPPFVAILPLREHAANAASYAGESVAVQQHAAYPDIAPLVTSVPPRRAFDAALDAARAFDWKIVAVVPDQGRIEAVATTPWFGFKDDVVVRVQAAETGSRVDVRSVSRVGRSDLGTNARRVRAFLAAVNADLARSG